MDNATRNLIQQATQAARRLLEEEYLRQLEGKYDIHSDGTIAPKPGRHLDDREKIVRGKIVSAIQHNDAGGAAPAEAVTTYLREAAFTTLNRFVALKMMEARDLVQECVSRGEESSGYKEFLLLAPGLSILPEQTYRMYIESLFDEIGLEVRVLFDRGDPASLLWPRRPALIELLGVLNSKVLKDVWAEDETIGWVYQYFNSKEERREMREFQAPRNSRELAVRNQFFTPRYVVRFLTDNTLGRIWYEMRKGNTALKEECLYLVRRPNEVFLTLGEKSLADTEGEADLSQEELLKKPIHIVHRPKKDPRDLRVLDPACGSGHFLLYSFDLLKRIYEEAWADPESPKSEVTGSALWEEFKSLGNLRRAIPKMIVEHNLHGIDIDQRAVQIAALALWLRAQKTWKNLSIRATERPRIVKSNIVTAEPMPGEEDMRREFTASLKPQVLGQLVDVVFKKMKLAGEAGSLLKIEEEIKDAVAEARKQWLQGPKPEQKLLFLPGMAAPAPKQQELRFEVKGITDERFLEQAEDRILSALNDYEERAGNGRAIRRRLFAEDAARGFAFIDLCRKRYDVVLMNPPFGEFSKPAKQYASSAYPLAKHDILAAFVQRAHELEHKNGRTGAITAGAWLYLETYADWRDRYIHKQHLPLIADLGFGVLDTAVVSTVAFCIENTQKIAHTERSLFWDLQREIQKETALIRVVSSTSIGEKNEHLNLRRVADFSAVPLKPIVYWVTDEILDLFKKFPPFEPSEGNVYQGIATGDNFRYLRLYWEINPNLLPLRDWVTYAKGGESTRFYDDISLVLRWSLNGADVKARADMFYGSASRTIKNEETFFKPGLTTTSTTVKGFTVRALPGAAIYDMAANKIAPLHNERLLTTLGVLNSLPIQVMMEFVTDGRHWYTSCIQRLPWPNLTDADAQQIEGLTRRAISLRIQHRGIEETSRIYVPSVRNISYETQEEEVQKRISEIVAMAFGLTVTAFSALQRITNIKTRDYEHEPLEDENANGGGGQSLLLSGEALVSHCVGVLFGRWDVRITLDPSLAAKLPDPFDPLPICPPGMLIGPAGLPAESGRIVSEEWLRARPDANTLPPQGSVKNPTIPDDKYPHCVSWEGLQVDDPGFGGGQPHKDDIVRRVREVLDLLFKDKAHDIEQITCDIIGVSDLREYFQKSTGFFQDHLKRYSKSRRKAPIYWRLSTSSGNYSVWLYYHRLTKDALYKVLNEYISPKIEYEERSLTTIMQGAGPMPSASQRKEIDDRNGFLAELRAFRDEIVRIAPLWNPELNDGVVINYAPLWRLVSHHRAWQKDLKECWDSLVAGEYEWSHLAMHLWPERIVQKCADDPSLAIAHGLENLFLEKDAKGKWKKRKVSSDDVKGLVTERTSSSVKAALNDLLFAAGSVENGKRTRKPRAKSTSKGKA